MGRGGANMNDFSLRKLPFLPTLCSEIARFLPCQEFSPWKCLGEQYIQLVCSHGLRQGSWKSLVLYFLGFLGRLRSSWSLAVWQWFASWFLQLRFLGLTVSITLDLYPDFSSAPPITQFIEHPMFCVLLSLITPLWGVSAATSSCGVWLPFVAIHPSILPVAHF